MKVTVWMLVYNHEKYIAKALDSVLMQEVDFSYEIIITDDYSTDGTREVLREYKEKHGDKIRLLLNDQNVGAMQTALKSYPQCCGDYVALLEGDDYWTDPHKLQLQVNYLEGKPDFSICFHEATIFDEDQGVIRGTFCYENQKEVSTLTDILRGNFIPTASVVFRNHLIREFPDWFRTMPMGDICLYILLAHHGKIGFINRNMSVYRIHSCSAWARVRQSRKMQLEISIKFWEMIQSNIEAADKEYIKEKLARHYAELESLS